MKEAPARAYIDMGFIGKDPLEVYHVFEHSGIKIYLDSSDSEKTTADCAVSFFQRQNYSSGHIKGFYYLRGHTRQVIYSRVLVGVLERGTLPEALNEIVHCLTFWNQEGADCYMMNAEKQESYDDFILKCIAADCRVLLEAHADLFETGKGHNHVWVAHKGGPRILFIHF